jgi:hypothetical protein
VNRNTEEFADPVDLPAGVHHCTSTAYNKYRCRCRYCTTWSRLYQRAREARRTETTRRQRRMTRDYLAYRGIQVWGSGPFRKHPLPLARLVARYLNDDLDQWLNREDES